MTDIQASNGEAGFMLVDALTGTAIIALMIALGQAQTARDVKDAQHLMAGLMEATPRIAGDYKGVSGGLVYDVKVESVTVNDVHMCDIAVAVREPLRRRVYRLQGTRWCSNVPVS